MTAKMLQAVRYDETELDEDALRKVRQELKETDESRRKCLETLKRKLLVTENLSPCLEEDFLLGYLRVSKYDCSKAYQRILGYYTERYNQPGIFKDYSSSTLKPVEIARQFYLCPYRSKDNSAIGIVKRGDYNPSKIPYDLILRAYSMIGDTLTQNPLNQLFGYTVLLDLKSSSWGEWSEYTPTRLKLIARLLQKTISARLRAIHIINAPSIYFLIYSIIYPFLSTKIRNRIFIHKTNKSLHSYIDPENIPKEYDGYLEQSELINLYERLYENDDYFQKLSKYGFNKK